MRATLVSRSAALLVASTAAASPPLKPQLEESSDPPAHLHHPLPEAPSHVQNDPGLLFTTGSQVNVSPGGFNVVGDAANEPSVAVDPTNRNRLAVGWRQFDSVTSNFRQAGNAYSRDGGRTWINNPKINPGVFRSDPVLCSSSSGDFYYNSLTNVSGGFTCDVYKSVDGGKTWGPPVAAAGGDKQWMICDQSASAGNGNLYTNWSAFASCCGNTSFVHSVNDGASFEPPLNVIEQPYWGTLTTDADGNLFILGDSAINTYFVVVKSGDAKNSPVAPTFSLAGTLEYSSLGTLPFGSANSPNPGGLLGQAWIDADRSNGPRRSWLYLVWSLTPPGGGDPLDVMFSRSTDGGATWSTPKRLNDDPVGSGNWHWFGTMSVAPNGRIDVIWNDTRNHPGSFRLSEVYYTSSSDGGSTWTTNRQLTPTFDSHVGWPNQNKIGDYYHMVSDDVGAHLIYAATFNGEQDVYCLRINDYDCNSNGIPDAQDIATNTSLDHDDDGIPNECEDNCPADINADQFVDAIDYDMFISRFLAGTPNADFNGDGFSDAIDYDRFIAAWFRGC